MATEINLDEVKRAVVQARTGLILDHPFFGALALRLKLVADFSCQTAWVDGVTMGYNPAFLLQLTPAERKGVMAHEVLHCANGHPWRRGQRHKRLWNMAADFAINGILESAKLALPEGALIDRRYTGLSAEEIYVQLPHIPDGGSDGSEDDDYGPGAVRDAPNPELAADNEAEWKLATVQAVQYAKAQGKLPDGLERLAEKITQGKVDWRALLRRFVQQAARTDYSWSRPNERYLHAGLYLPSLRNENLANLVVAVDTSGSIGNEELSLFAAEINDIVCEAQPESTYVIYADAEVQRVDEFTQGETVALTPIGGGGTDFRPVFDWVDIEGLSPSCLIYLTDLCGRFPNTAPEYPVLWATTNRRRPAPWGETIDIIE